jgi:hypothetical protein
VERGIRPFLATPPQPHGRSPTDRRRKGGDTEILIIEEMIEAGEEAPSAPGVLSEQASRADAVEAIFRAMIGAYALDRT